ncbi:MAG: hypothetical protein ABIJ16_01765 [Bacteroidota bacterium]
MKKAVLISITLLCVLTVFGQKEVATPDELKTFFNTKTMVVVDDNPLSEYNMEIKDVVKKNWKLTEYEFIDETKFEKLRMDANYSFLTVDKVFFDKDKTQAHYEFLCLSLGGNYRTTTDMPQLCAVPLCYYGVDEESYVYKIGTLINFIQNHVLLTSKNPDLNSDNIITHYNRNISSVKEKTFYIIKDEMADDADTETEIKKVYPYKIQFVTRDDIQEAIAEDNDEVVFLHKVGPEGTKSNARCFKILMGANDAQLYYFDYHMIDDEKKQDGFLLKDFKKLANQ